MSSEICLRCARCSSTYEAARGVYICAQCGTSRMGHTDIIRGHLEVKYQLGKVSLSKSQLSMRPKSMWRYMELLPVADPAKIISIGEGFTPLHRCKRLSEHLGLKSLYIKNETLNPTGSFKDRSASSEISKGLEFGESIASCASSGNMGSALAGYCARAGIEAVIFAMEAITPAALQQIASYGAKLIMVKGSYDQASFLCGMAVGKFGWYNCNHGFNPYMVEGNKTIALEIAEQLGWDAPRRVIVPTGSGGSLAGQWKGFKEFLDLGLICDAPSMVAAQTAAGAPLVRAFTQGLQDCPPIATSASVADGILVGHCEFGTLALRALRESKGSAIAVTDEQILNAQRLLSKLEGIYVEPSGASSLAAALNMLERGQIDRDEIMVCIATGGGLKQLPSLAQLDMIKIEPDSEALEDLPQRLFGQL